MEVNDPKSRNGEEEQNQKPNDIDTPGVFHINPVTIKDDTADDEEEDIENFDDHDEMDEYGSSGEKYGWYNGWSDDAIDDAFEGDPMNTWNVD